MEGAFIHGDADSNSSYTLACPLPFLDAFAGFCLSNFPANRFFPPDVDFLPNPPEIPAGQVHNPSTFRAVKSV